MTLLTPVQSIVAAGTTPSPFTPTASDTINGSEIGSRGAYLRVITTGTATNVTVADPNTTVMSNPAAPAAVACPATGVRMIFISPNAVNASGLVTITATGALTGVTYELYRV
jgi:hypothetical protein